jgi:hypothetical protein
VIKVIGYNYIPDFLLQPYMQFFNNFIPNEKYSNAILKILLCFARKIKANVKWV